MEEIKLTEAELKQWCDDNDANYWTQEITEDNKVAIRGIHEVLGTYDFNTETLTLTEGYLEETPYVEEYVEDEKEDKDFIKGYVTYEDLEGKEHPSWYFVNKIATAEGIDEGCVCQLAKDLGYKLFAVEAPGFGKVAVAAKGVKAEDVYNDYADYLQGRACVYEVK